MRNSDFHEIMSGLKFNLIDCNAAIAGSSGDTPSDCNRAGGLGAGVMQCRYVDVEDHDFVFFSGMHSCCFFHDDDIFLWYYPNCCYLSYTYVITGDLNYRISLSVPEVLQWCDSRDWAFLLASDQVNLLVL